MPRHIESEASYHEGNFSSDRITARKHDVVESNLVYRGEKFIQRAGTFLLSESGRDRATMGFTAYHEHTALRDKPITFFVGGGPIIPSTSMIDVRFSGPRIGPKLKKNPDSLIELTDLVHPDAINTGYGQTLEGEDKKLFFGFERDAQSFAAFIEAYLKEYKIDPKKPLVLAGTSYGAGFRMIEVANILKDRGIPIDGLLLINPHFDYAMEADRPGSREYQEGLGDIKNDPRPYMAALPVMALTHDYYKNGKSDFPKDSRIEDLYREIENFTNLYNRHFSEFENPNFIFRNLFIDLLAQYTGLSPKLIEDYNLKIPTDVFLKNYFPDQVLSRLDTRRSFPKKDIDENDPTDPLIKEINFQTRELAAERIRDIGFAKETERKFGDHILAYPDWTFPDETRSSHRAMQKLRAEQPELIIEIVVGRYDAANPPLLTKMFLHENDIPFTERHHLLSLYSKRPRPKAGVNITTIPTGHFIDGRNLLFSQWTTSNNLFESVTERARIKNKAEYS